MVLDAMESGRSSPEDLFLDVPAALVSRGVTETVFGSGG
jgi:hypothetical protein